MAQVCCLCDCVWGWPSYKRAPRCSGIAAVAFRVFKPALITQAFPPLLPTTGDTRTEETQPWDLPRADHAHTDMCPGTDIGCFEAAWTSTSVSRRGMKGICCMILVWNTAACKWHFWCCDQLWCLTVAAHASSQICFIYSRWAASSFFF